MKNIIIILAVFCSFSLKGQTDNFRYTSYFNVGVNNIIVNNEPEVGANGVSFEIGFRKLTPLNFWK